MKISDFEIRHLELPLRATFSHASQTRKKADSVVILVRSASGDVGYGEGCPRSYVTGETWESSKGFFNKIQKELKVIETYNDLLSWVGNHERDIDRNPAAWCAIELAILDLLGKENRQSVEEVLGLPRLSGEFQYSAVIGTRHTFTFYVQTLFYRLKGFNGFKIKIFGEEKTDKQKMKFLNRVGGKQIKVRVDANNLWSNPEEAIRYLKSFSYKFFAIEEPIAANQYEALSIIGNKLNTPIILDESFLRLDHFQKLNEFPTHWIINVRISKMGGLIRSLKVCEEARKRKIPIIIGAQVGETSILTRAALSIANVFRDILVAQEGAFGTYLLSEDIATPSIRFGRNGILKTDGVRSEEKYGLGLKINLSYAISKGYTRE